MMSPELKQQIINRLQTDIDHATEYNQPKDSASWGAEEGAILTIEEAQEVVKLLKSL